MTNIIFSCDSSVHGHVILHITINVAYERCEVKGSKCHMSQCNIVLKLGRLVVLRHKFLPNLHVSEDSFNKLISVDLI